MIRSLTRSLKVVSHRRFFSVGMMEGAATSFAMETSVESMATAEDTSDNKRSQSDDELSEEGTNKKLKMDEEPGEKRKPFRKKKMLLLMVYSGKGYLGMQRNPGVETIEGDLMAALLKAGVVTEEQAADPGRRMQFQRAARTDKGVSALGQACSLMMSIDVENPMDKINSHLADQIRVIGLQRVTKKFDSKNAADARTYMYMTPTFAFTPCQEFVLESFRITEEICQQVNETLQLFKGTHNFHNFTSGKKPTDHSAKRYIMDFKMGEPFVRDGMEFVVLTVKGQSFMLHQIRKMIGMTMAIVMGLTGPEAVEKAYKSQEKCDIPKAPGLGLVLDKVHYDFYNRKFGKDGIHEPILWEKYEDKIEEFRQKHIYPTIVQTEKEERSMMKWLSTLHLHKFDEREATSPKSWTGIGRAQLLLNQLDREEKAAITDQQETDSPVEIPNIKSESSPPSPLSIKEGTQNHQEAVESQSNEVLLVEDATISSSNTSLAGTGRATGVTDMSESEQR